jgi:hypothetical protein
MSPIAPLSIDGAETSRRAGRDWLSLALIDSRNRSLRWLARFESAGMLHGASEWPDPPLRRIAAFAARRRLV